MKLPILQYGDPMLRAKGKRIRQLPDDRIRELAANMLETMQAANGVGLAAQQVGEALQLTVLDISRVEDRPSTMKLNGQDVDPQTAMPLVLINPEIEWRGSEQEIAEEGCLSLPTVLVEVERPIHVRVRATDEHGGPIVIEASGLEARIVPRPPATSPAISVHIQNRRPLLVRFA